MQIDESGKTPKPYHVYIGATYPTDSKAQKIKDSYWRRKRKDNSANFTKLDKRENIRRRTNKIIKCQYSCGVI
jgi:hypothetical protein